MATTAPEARTTPRARTLQNAWWIPPLLVTALFHLRSLHDDFVADAVFLLRDNRLLAWPPAGGVRGSIAHALTHDYFNGSGAESVSYYRPVAKLSWLFEAWAWGTERPEPFHLVQIAWMVLATAAVCALARSLGASRTAAILAGCFFGTHVASIEPVSLLMARSDVTAAAGLLGALATFHAWLRTGARKWLAWHALAALVALGSKELSVMLVPVEALWLVVSPRVHSLGKRRWIAIVPTVGFALALLVARNLVLAGRAPAHIDVNPLRSAVMATAYLRGLLGPPGEPAVHFMAPTETHATVTLGLTALTLVALGAVVAWRARVRDVDGLVLVAAALAWLVPVLLVADVSVASRDLTYPLSDRWLLTTTGTFAAVFSAWISQLPRERTRRLLAWAAGAWCAIAFVTGSALQALYRDEETMLVLEDEALERVPPEWRAPRDVCASGLRRMVRALAHGDANGALAVHATLAPACRDDAFVRYNEFMALARAGRFAEARTRGDALRTRELPGRIHAAFASTYGAVLLATGDPDGAFRMLHTARTLGLHDCTLLVTTARAAHAAGHAAQAASTLAEAAECPGVVPPPPVLWLLAAQSWQSAGDGTRACAALSHVPDDPRAAPMRAALHCP